MSCLQLCCTLHSPPSTSLERFRVRQLENWKGFEVWPDGHQCLLSLTQVAGLIGMDGHSQPVAKPCSLPKLSGFLIGGGSELKNKAAWHGSWIGGQRSLCYSRTVDVRQGPSVLWSVKLKWSVWSTEKVGLGWSEEEVVLTTGHSYIW